MSNILSLAFKGIKTPNTIFSKDYIFCPFISPQHLIHLITYGLMERVSGFQIWYTGVTVPCMLAIMNWGNMIFPVFVKEWETYPGVIETILGNCKRISGDLTYHVMDIDIHSNVR